MFRKKNGKTKKDFFAGRRLTKEETRDNITYGSSRSPGKAGVAQVVAHLIGSEEVTGPSPVASSLKGPFLRAFFFV